MIKRKQRFGYLVLSVPFLKFFNLSCEFVSFYCDDLFSQQRLLSGYESFWIAVVYLVMDICFAKCFK